MRSYVLALVLSVCVSTIQANEYDIQIEKVHDGDTFTCTIDLGFDVSINKQIIRIKNFDAWEIDRTRRTIIITDEELVKGKLAREALVDLFLHAKRIYVEDGKRGVYGRMELRVFVDGNEVAQVMKDAGHDRTWKGRKEL